MIYLKTLIIKSHVTLTVEMNIDLERMWQNMVTEQFEALSNIIVEGLGNMPSTSVIRANLQSMDTLTL